MKIFKFKSSFEINRITKEPVRNGNHLNRLLIKTITSIINGTAEYVDTEKGDYDICICVEKMSRIFYYTPTKAFSMCFPFYINYIIGDEMGGDFIIKDISSNITIDLNISNLLSALFSDDCILEKDLEDTYFELDERLQISYEDFSLSTNAYPIRGIWVLVSNLLKTELGYLRYDYDEKNCSGDRHPLRHIDVYFSNQNTFKIGLEESIDILEILDNTKERFYLKRKS